MKYVIDYQYLPRNAGRPIDDGSVVPIIIESSSGGTVILPSVGDYVQIANGSAEGRSSFDGKVRSRLFRYIRTGVGDDEVGCVVNIVVEETSDDWGRLVKE